MKIKLLDFPELRQVYNFDCGGCLLCCVLAYYGVDAREEYVMKLAGTNEDGTSLKGMIRVVEYYGLKADCGTKGVDDLRAAIDRGWPTMVTLQAYRGSNVMYSDAWDDGHWVAAIGYSDSRIYFEDPSSFRRTWLADVELLDRWHDVDEGRKISNWGCTVIGEPCYSQNDSVHMD